MTQLIKSTSGIRGVIGESLTPDIALKTGLTLGTINPKGTIIIGGDTRTSHTMLKNSLTSGLIATGCNIIDIGKVPTPTLQQMISYYNASGGVMITASHNPIIWNGLKLMNKHGSFFSEEEFNNFSKLYDSETFKLSDWENQGNYKLEHNAINKHIEKIFSIFPQDPIKNSNLKVLIDPNNGAGCIATPLLLDKLFIYYEILNSKPSGIFSHTPEPTKDNLEQLQLEMKKGNFDIGFAQDPDADRLVIIDEKGTFIGEDYSLAFCLDYILNSESKANKNIDIVTNLSTSNLIETIGNKYNAKTHYTKIGEVNVSNKIKDLQALVGGEGNGGIIYPKVGWGRDSLTGIMIALLHLASTKRTVSEIISQYPKYYLSKDKLAVNNINLKELNNKIIKLFPSAEQITLDGLKLVFSDSWIHIRASNTEPIIRIFAESKDKNEADNYIKKIKTLL